jgi:hypothetical protein
MTKKHAFTQKELRRQAYQNAAALIESMDLSQLYGDFGLTQLDEEPDCGERMDAMQREVAAYLRKRVEPQSDTEAKP